MMRFSERHGHIERQTALQIEEINDALRNKLWNALDVCIWKAESTGTHPDQSPLAFLIYGIWNDLYKAPIDQIDTYWFGVIQQIRKIYFDSPWYEAYDLVEYVAQRTSERGMGDQLIDSCNLALEEELSGYRFIKGQLAPITSKTEVSEVEEAIDRSPNKAASAHISRALELMAQKPKPDFRNSIKESISAVESACILVSNKDKATLGDAIKTLGKKMSVHPALEKAFSSMYGYTSDAKGIRHAIVDELPNLAAEDAKYMLVVCSAFVNYLFVKADKAKIKI